MEVLFLASFFSLTSYSTQRMEAFPFKRLWFRGTEAPISALVTQDWLRASREVTRDKPSPLLQFPHQACGSGLSTAFTRTGVWIVLAVNHSVLSLFLVSNGIVWNSSFFIHSSGHSSQNDHTSEEHPAMWESLFSSSFHLLVDQLISSLLL